jgi:hypothetical protein
MLMLLRHWPCLSFFFKKKLIGIPHCAFDGLGRSVWSVQVSHFRSLGFKTKSNSVFSGVSNKPKYYLNTEDQLWTIKASTFARENLPILSSKMANPRCFQHLQTWNISSLSAGG